MIEILKASAGSGKTWNLAKEYIALLLENYASDPYAYRHILAVTFTNKATDEMKTRILDELYGLAYDTANSDYRNIFIPGYMPDEMSLNAACRNILSNMLHDYAAFSVSTIDRFFQQVLKAFSRELGQFAAYQVELDRKSLIHESVDRLLDSLDSADPATLDWISDYFIKNVEDGNKYSLENSLHEMAERLESPKRQRMLESCGMNNVPADKKLIRDKEKKLRGIIADYKKKLSDKAVRINDLCFEAGFSPSDTAGSFLSAVLKPYTEAEDLKKRSVRSFGLTDLRMGKMRNPGSVWFKKADQKRYVIGPELIEASKEFAELLDGDERRLCVTAEILLRQMYGLGLADEMSRSFRELLREKNVLSIDDSDTILRDIIDGTEAPFIYEKLGVRLDHFLLDEFQDTSRVQWANFRPLLDNSVANGNSDLIVGDVKQSIYRWRGSDWDLLNNQVAAEFSGCSKTRTLDTNFRSLKEVVEFNNGFFAYAAELLQKMYDPSGSEITSIYSDVAQKVSDKKAHGGKLGFDFCKGRRNETVDRQLARVLELISEALDMGFGYRDIAVLVRDNQSGCSVAKTLLDNGIKVVTDESLKVRSSRVVRRLIGLLTAIDRPGDELAGYMEETLKTGLPQTYNSLMDLCEDLLRRIKAADEETFKAETPYIQSLMDLVQKFVSNSGGGLHALLQMLADDDSSISSPDSGDAVRVMTVHKSKGLEIPYVIVPFAEKITLYRDKFSSEWFRPEVAGTGLEFADGVYDVGLNEAKDGLFGQSLKKEKLQQYVDNLNLAYVAFTRAGAVLRVVGTVADDKVPGDDGAIKNLADILYRYADANAVLQKRNEDPASGDCGQEDFRTYTIGEDFDYRALKEAGPEEKKGGRIPDPLNYSYVSWPLGEQRLGFNHESADFFSADAADDGEAGGDTTADMDVDARRRGIVLHDILSSVSVPSDLKRAVDAAVAAGSLSAEKADGIFSMLEKKIAYVSSRGWFPEDRGAVWTETELMNVSFSSLSTGMQRIIARRYENRSGEVAEVPALVSLRPDRVVSLKDGSIAVIDYKFGGRRKSYITQVNSYGDIYRSMGYTDVRTYLWYVDDDEVVETKI